MSNNKECLHHLIIKYQNKQYGIWSGYDKRLNDYVFIFIKKN